MLEETGAGEAEGGIISFQPGDIVNNRYEIVKILQEGDWDASYQALDRKKDDRMVWIKQKYEPGNIRRELERQKKLFMILRDNPHRNVARPLDIFRRDSSIFVVMENLHGENLQKIIGSLGKAPGQDKIKDLAVQAARGLSFLHENSILHLDIQPAHFFLTDAGVLKLTGFSRIASVNDSPSDFAVTEGYSPPEAYGLVGGNVGPHSDIYSLGATIYSLITGRAPKLSRENFFIFQPLNDTDLLIDPIFEKIIMRAVKKEPGERFSSVDNMLTALKALKDKEETPRRQPLQPPNLEFEVVARSHVGKVRSTNQDSCLVTRFGSYEKSKPNFWELLVVADGMGGEAEGDKASSLAIRVIASEVLQSFMPINVDAETMRLYSDDNLQEKSGDILKRAVLRANSVVFDYSRMDPARRGMGSTISAGLIIKNNLCLCHAGDTRGYVFNRHFGLMQLTEDHSLVGRLVRLGQLTREEALRSPQRSAVYRALGTTPDLEVDVYHYNIKPGDIIILCSDGVWEYFPDQELISIILEEAVPDKIADRLIATCLERGADDNATLVCLRAKGAVEHPKTLRLDEKAKVIPQILEKRQEEKAEERAREQADSQKEAKEKRRREGQDKKRMREEAEKKRMQEEAEKTVDKKDTDKPLEIREVVMEDGADDEEEKGSSPLPPMDRRLREELEKKRLSSAGPDTEPLEIPRGLEDRLVEIKQSFEQTRESSVESAKSAEESGAVQDETEDSLEDKTESPDSETEPEKNNAGGEAKTPEAQDSPGEEDSGKTPATPEPDLKKGDPDDSPDDESKKKSKGQGKTKKKKKRRKKR